MTDRDLDAAIDRAVRDVTEREPPAGFRDRVLSRIEEPHRHWWRLSRLAAGAALATASLLAFVLVGRGPAPSRVDQHTDVAQPARLSPPAVQRVPDPDEQSALEGGTSFSNQPAAPAVRRQMPGRSAPGPYESSIAIPPLPAIDAIEFQPLQPSETGPAAVMIPPLPELAPVQIEALSPPVERQ